MLQDRYNAVVIPRETEILSCRAQNRKIVIPDFPNGAEPALLKLNTFPRIMSADRPVAKVQLEGIDSNQNSLDPKGLMLESDIGELSVAIVDNTLLADYDGSNAQLLGGDTLTATWNKPAKAETPFSFECQTYREGLERFLQCKVKSALNNPVAQVTAHFRSGQNILSSQTTDDLGRLDAVSITKGTQIISVATEEIIQRFYIEPLPPDETPSKDEHSVSISSSPVVLLTDSMKPLSPYTS